MNPASPPLRLFDQVQAFQYVVAEKAPIYRAIVQVFSEARHHYVIELRPAEVLDRIRAAGIFVALGPDETLDYYLDMLVKWGNLASAQDSATVTRLEDFYRKRLLYRLTPAGEAAHRAVAEVEDAIGRSGRLQASMLVKIRDELRELTGDREPSELVVGLHDLNAAFESLTEEANRFIGDLDRPTGAKRMDEERFTFYKRALLAYIHRFVGQLRLLGDEIRALIDGIDAEALIDRALPGAELPPARDDADPRADWRAEWLARWTGIRAWFVGTASSMPTVERLAAVAVEAVLGLTRSLGRLSGASARSMDRAADFRVLAHWFGRCPDDRAAHGLWHAAFGLSTGRHFHLESNVEGAPSWWDAAPVEVPVRLRERGQVAVATGRAGAIPDYSAARQWLEQKRRQERAQLDAAIRRLSGEFELRDVGRLDPAEFDLFLALLDQALAAPKEGDGSQSARTIDGRVRIRLTPPKDDELVVLEAPGGRLWCRNHHLEVSAVEGAAWRSEAR
ncbi:TIGR02677 family protein [Vulgatibacter incomptus]|uniref:TIGR02677 family protein n=1 Tax=Vulgatibacter incomptus TaxID=1391653 RepID=A0A0K1PI14_9BACT|nr:TIGR02677 family protein [Vulgatibacter incomptus]AKU92734.1 Hypothetical protein AKJ08_3121 [Vulgatibacter incomptus]